MELNETSVSVNLNDFVQNLFSQPPAAPFTYRLDLDMQDRTTWLSIMQSILLKGIEKKYRKFMHELQPEEIAMMRDYFLSFGWDASYEIENLQKDVVDYHEDGSAYPRTIMFNKYKITFNPANPSLNGFNSHRGVVP
jgi:hypothetical protein